MARTHGDLFPKIRDFQNLRRAHIVARRGKRNRYAVQAYEQDLEGNLLALQRALDAGTYQTGPYHVFTIVEPKARTVAALPYEHRVAQQAIVSVIEPLWECSFDPHNYACRPGRGMHRGADYAQHLLRACLHNHGQVHVLKADIASYFRSIDHQILRRLLERRIRCTRTLDLCNEIIDSARTIHDGRAQGLPIGNRTSQLWANVYLDALDRHVRHQLRVRHYARYMDDFIIVHPNKPYLHAMRRAIDDYLGEALALRLNDRTQVFPVGGNRGRGLDYLGYHLWPTHRRLRQSSIRRIQRAIRLAQAAADAGRLHHDRFAHQLQSWQAHAAGANTLGLQRAILAAERIAPMGVDPPPPRRLPALPGSPLHR